MEEKTTIKISDLFVKFSNLIVWAVRILVLFDIIMLIAALLLGIQLAFMTTSIIFALIIGGLLWSPIILKFIKKIRTYKFEW